MDSCLFWDNDDLTSCSRTGYFNYRFPLVTLVITIVSIGYNMYSSFWKFSRIKLTNDNDDDLVDANAGSFRQHLGNHLLAIEEDDFELDFNRDNDDDKREQTIGSSYNPIPNKNIDLKKRHFDITSNRRHESASYLQGFPVIVSRSFLDKSRVIVEFLMVLSQVVIHFTFLSKVRESTGSELFVLGTLVRLLHWLVLSFIVALRLININESTNWISSYPGNLWTLSFTNYMILFILQILPYRSTVIGHVEIQIDETYYTHQFYMNMFLFMILVFSPIRNSYPILYKSNPSITPSPEPNSSIASFISFTWLNELIWTAHKRPLELKDIWGLVMDDYSIVSVKDFKKYYTKKKSTLSFSRIFLQYFSDFFILQWSWAIISAVFSFIPTMLLKRILEYVDDQSSGTPTMAWLYVFGMFLSRGFVSICQGQILFFARRVSIRMKSIITSEIYSKTLKKRLATTNVAQSLDKEELKNDNESDKSKYSDSNNGTVINLMSVDSSKVAELCAYVHSFIEAISMSIIALILLYYLLGVAAFVGVIIIVAFIPVNFFLTKLMTRFQREGLVFTDERLQNLNELFQAIRIVKFFSWEENFVNDIEEVRGKEIQQIKRNSLTWSISAFFWFLSPTLITSVSFSYYIFVDKQELTIPVAFTALSLFGLLKTPLDQLSNTINFVAQSKVSLDRIQNFLNEEETKKYNSLEVDPLGNRIAFEDVTVSWNNMDNSFKLRNINIEFKTRELNVVIGPTGSGKTLLLMALLGEAHPDKGTIIVPSLEPRHELIIESDGMTNSVAFCSQTAWIINDTIKNNILFSHEYNKNKYEAVIQACCLKRDFEILLQGDQTMVGDKGLSLSGGQRQRISLARALYSHSRHVILDDCLSAVDSHSATWIYNSCITGPLMKGRTCIFVSHNVSLVLKKASLVVVLEGGRIRAHGSAIELLNDESLISSGLIPIISISTSTEDRMSENKSSVTLTNIVSDDLSYFPDLYESKAQPFRDDETQVTGSVSFDVYKWYFDMFGGWRKLLIIVGLFLTAQSNSVCQSWWIRHWLMDNLNINEENPHNIKISVSANLNVAYYLFVYCMIGFHHSLLSGFKLAFSYFAGIDTSKRIFNKVLKSVIHSKINFFDTTPAGRIMNRFSKDVEAVDLQLTPFIDGTFACMIQALTSLVLIIFVTPKFLFVAVFISILSVLIGHIYLTCSRELKRFESTTKSPIYQHFSETLSGTVTIRAYGDENRFLLENLQRIDENNKSFFFMWAVNCWLSFRIDLLGSLAVFGSGAFILMNIENIDSGMAGISLSYAITFTEFALWMVKFYSTVEMNMNSVERLKEYMNIEQEPYLGGINDLSTIWPSEGRIHFEDFSLRYSPELPRVIKNVTFTIDAKSKIGIVGRTGAGKSTIVTALFRFLEADSGSITIDGIDISTLNLKKLRTSMTIIPQDPILFSGTIKSNIDPFGEYTDETVYEALMRVNLLTMEEIKDSIKNSSQNKNVKQNYFLTLTNSISEGGSNISQGQRQLLCLARSLLRCSKIILLDEATASVDYNSDFMIQKTIRTEFSDLTILTIAHRLKSVIDYDKILVLDAGEVVEYDHPHKLIENRNSTFYSMCEQTGELELLKELSRNAYIGK